MPAPDSYISTCPLGSFFPMTSLGFIMHLILPDIYGSKCTFLRCGICRNISSSSLLFLFSSSCSLSLLSASSLSLLI